MTPPSSPSATPGRLRLRRRLLLWSIPVLVLMMALAVKLGSVWVLGNRLPNQFSDRDHPAMGSTLHWLNVGWFGGGHRAQFAEGDRLLLQGNISGAHDKFRAAHLASPQACPPRVNFALTSERLSNEQLTQGRFFAARELLEPAVEAAVAQPQCFTRSLSPVPEVRLFVEGTPERLSNKLTALKRGWITETPDGYDYIRVPGGGIDISGKAVGRDCPFVDDELRLKECIGQRAGERDEKVREAQAKAEAEDAPPAPPVEPPPPPDQAAPPPPPPPASRPPQPADPQFPTGARTEGSAGPGFCTPDGTPLHDLGALLCETSGPLE